MRKSFTAVCFMMLIAFSILCVPKFALADDQPSTADLLKRIEQLEKEVADLKANQTAVPPAAQPAAQAAQPVTAQKAEKGEFSGKAYIAYDYHTNSSAKAANAFKIDRSYLTYSGKTGPNTKYTFTSDVLTTPVAGGKFDMFMKAANFEKTNVLPNKGSLIFGLQPTTWIGYQEAAWKYRSVEKTAEDLDGIYSSADFGLGAKGKFENGEYHILLDNGTGYGAVASSHKKELQARTTFALGKNAPHISLFGGFGGAAGLKNNSVAFSLNSQMTSLSYGLDYMINRKNAAPGGTVTKRDVYSMFFNYDFGKTPWSVLGRYDVYDPDKHVSANNQTLALLGGAYKIDKNTKFILSDELKKDNGAKTKDNALRGTVEVNF